MPCCMLSADLQSTSGHQSSADTSSQQPSTSGSFTKVVITPEDLKEYVGPPPFASDKIYGTTPPGVVMGLAWTSMGGNSLYVEAAGMERGLDKGGTLRTTGSTSTLGVPISLSCNFERDHS